MNKEYGIKTVVPAPYHSPHPTSIRNQKEKIKEKDTGKRR